MGKRHEKIGIKQTIQKHWMDRTVQMMLAGMPEKEIRLELDNYLATQKQSGGIGKSGKKNYGMAMGILASWFSPEKELVSFRDDLLKIAKNSLPQNWISLHWAIISASYPFWFNVAKHVGRLLNLQDQITQAQVFNRLKEIYGDRETVARNARYTVRSFVAWNVLLDSVTRGCYERHASVIIADHNLAVLMLEASLLANPEGKAAIDFLWNDPAFFPFQLPVMTGDFISQHSDRIDVFRYGLNEELLKLRKN